VSWTCPGCGQNPCVNPSFCAACDDNRPSSYIDDHAVIGELAALLPLDYQRQRLNAAHNLGLTVGALDKLVRSAKAKVTDDESVLPHWKVEPWSAAVSGAALLDDIEKVFRRYIVLPKGAGTALALWTLHAWTMDAGDISPFLVLVSPTKRCGKTNTLIVLFYITPRSELASNISASALFRYVEQVRPTLLIDEADSFLKDNEEMRGILDSGHTKTAAHVIRNVEVNGEHKPRRFSTWAPKAIATIRGLADTLEDRSVVLTLQRKPPGARVERLRKRDSGEFATLRRRLSKWAEDNLSALADPDPAIPDALNDRAADNWRPLLAIADLAGGEWPRKAREAARRLSGEGHDSSSINVDLLADIRLAFGDAEAIRSGDLVAKLTADPEKPWVEWKHGKPLTQKQLGGLLRPFGITSETVSISGLADAKGYRRTRFEEAWEAYLPGQNTLAHQIRLSEASKRRNADGSEGSSDFRSVAEGNGDGSKNANLSNSHAGSDASTDRKPGNGAKGRSDHENGTGDFRDSLRRCAQCNAPGDARGPVIEHDDQAWLHRECQRFWLKEHTPNVHGAGAWTDWPWESR
jgi:putative DNA primase/helicase